MESSNQTIIVGLDIGGANTKAALLSFNMGVIEASFSIIEYFPFWEKSISQIPEMLSKIVDKLLRIAEISSNEIDFYAVAITAELSDAFYTKKEGINTILDALSQTFREDQLYFISTQGKFIKIDNVRANFSQISAANWVATALFLGHFVKDGILIDSGSTTIDLIPLINGKPSTSGKTDLERLIHHELIYTGGLRATIPSITHFVPYNGKLIRISFEKFALVSDVHMILNHISEQEYINDTADNRTRSIKDCYARLSRIVCADIESIDRNQLNQIANYVYDKQIEIILSEVKLFMGNITIRYPNIFTSPKFYITGLSAEFLIRPTLYKLGYKEIFQYEKETNIPDNVSSSAFAVAGALYFQLQDKLN